MLNVLSMLLSMWCALLQFSLTILLSLCGRGQNWETESLSLLQFTQKQVVEPGLALWWPESRAQALQCYMGALAALYFWLLSRWQEVWPRTKWGTQPWRGELGRQAVSPAQELCHYPTGGQEGSPRKCLLPEIRQQLWVSPVGKRRDPFTQGPSKINAKGELHLAKISATTKTLAFSQNPDFSLR